MFAIQVDRNIILYLVQEQHYHSIYKLLDNNREHIHAQLPIPIESAEVTRDFTLWTKKLFAEKGDLHCHIFYDGQPAGMIGLHHQHQGTLRFWEIGYWLAEEFTGKGIITRAAKTMTDYVFTELNSERVIIRTSTTNDKSAAVAERLGYQLEGILRKSAVYNAQAMDMRLYAILRDEWTLLENPPVLAHQVDENIQLRLVEWRHADAIFALVEKNREHLGRWLPWVESSTSVDSTKEFIATALEQYGRNDGFQASIWYQGELVGMIGFHMWDFADKKTEIGYWLAESHTGKGIMTKAVQAIVKYAFETLDLNRVEILCAVGNDKSCAIPERLGFIHEGILRKSHKLHGKLIDMNIFALLAEE